MGRSRDDDGGLIGELVEELLALARRWPAAGVVLAGMCVAGGAWLTWVRPKAVYGVGWFLGWVLFVSAGVFALAAGVGMLAERRERAGTKRTMEDSRSQISDLKREGPLCPVCGGGMVRRVARRGVHAGKGFWGCARYPECEGIVEG